MNKIYVAGHRGMVGSAIVRALEEDSLNQIITRTHQELDLTNQAQVRAFFDIERPSQVYLAAAKVGGIHANNTYPAEFIYENLMAAVIDYEVRKVGEEIRYLEDQYERSEIRFEAAQAALAQFTDRNRGTLSATAQIEAQRFQNEFNLAFEIYRNFSTELEQARIKQNRDTPIFTVLESVTIPNQRTSPKRGQTLLLYTFLGAFLGVAVISARLFLNTFDLHN